MNIEQLKEEEKRILSDLSAVKEKIKNIELDECFKKYGVRVDSIVSVEVRKFGQPTGDVKEYLVTRITTYSRIEPSIEGRLRKKNGEFGKRATHIWGEITVVKP